MGAVLYVCPVGDGDHRRRALERRGATVRAVGTPDGAAVALADDDRSVECVVVERRPAPDADRRSADGPGESTDGPGESTDGPGESTDATVGEDPALGAVAAVRDRRPDLPVLCWTGAPDGEFAAEATRLGATEYGHDGGSGPSLADRVAAYLDAEGTDGRAAGTGPSDDGTTGAVARDGGADASPVESPAGGSPFDSEMTPADRNFDVTPALLDAVEDGLYLLDAGGHFLAVNEAMTSLTGYATGELVGAHASMILDEADEERALETVRALERGDVEETTFTTTIEPKRGSAFPVEDHVTALTDDDGELVGVAGVLRDVTDEREREAELERYESIIEAVDDGVYALDDRGRFEVVNDALLELTGYDREELLGEHTAVIKDEETVELAERKLRELLRGEDVETTFDLPLQPKSGDSIPVEDHMTMLTDDGEFDGTAGVVRDITERKERERQLRDARERFADLLENSRALLSAHSHDAVAETVAEAVSEALGYELTVVRLYDAETDRLEPVAGSVDAASADAAAEADTDSGSDPDGSTAVTDRPVYGVGEGGPGVAFEAGEILRYPTDFEGEDARGDALDVEVAPPDPVTETLFVPLGEQGVVSIGATERDAFDETELSMAEILSSNATVALERVAYEEELVQYRTVLENVQDMVYVIDENERFSLVTDPLAEWLGYDRAELEGARPTEVFEEAETETFESVIADLWYDDAEHLDDTADPEDGESARSKTVETELVTADGEPRPATVEVSLLPVEESFAGSVGVVRDRSELVETREKLETQRDRFTYLFDNLPDPVVEGTIRPGTEPIPTAVNDAFTEVFGYEPDEVVGESLNEYILPPDEREPGNRLDERTATGEVVQEEVRRKTADGYRDFLFRGIPYDTSGRRTRGFGIYTDITEQKERQRRLEVLNRVLRHNLRNDLNVVLGYAEMVEGNVSDDRVLEWAETLRRKAAAVATLGDRVRTLDRQLSRGSPRDGTVSLDEVVADPVAEFRADHPRATVETDVPALPVVGDSRLALALSEALDNCVTHVGPDVHVRVTAARDGDRVSLRVADDGPGIPENERAVVTGETEITQLTHASGLGLWIVKWICQACGGRLRFEESSLGGTAVVLSLTPANEE